MRNMFSSTVLAFALIAGGTAPAYAAAPCKDAKGKFIKCAPAATTAAAVKPVAKPAAAVAKPAAKPAAAAAKPTKVAAKTATGKKAPCRDAKGRFTKC